MSSANHPTVTARHLNRNAYLYVRQATVAPFENSETTTRQYDLRQRAIALGWPYERIIVIDSDLGQSGASAVGRRGFQQLLAAVATDHAGIILALDLSRLSRNPIHLHQLLELCAQTDTLILDEQGIHDPTHLNDQWLLGPKGNMSEPEIGAVGDVPEVDQRAPEQHPNNRPGSMS